jgi:hypothetical protein
MKVKIILIGALFITLLSSAQTNQVSTNAVQISKILPGLISIIPEPEQHDPLAEQREAVKKAMPEFYTIEQDSVDDTKTISLNEYETLEYNDDNHLKMDVVAFIHPPQKLPDRISLHFISHSSEWRFLDDHDFTIRYDDTKLSVGNLSYANKVLDDATVTEQIWPDFTIQQFHDIAWANSVYIKIGYKNYEIPYDIRQKWKLLWKYFDLQKPSPKEEDLKKAIGEKP